MNFQDVLTYQSEDDSVSVDRHHVEDKVSLSLNKISDLFERGKGVTAKYWKDIFQASNFEFASVVVNFTPTGKHIQWIIASLMQFCL